MAVDDLIFKGLFRGRVLKEYWGMFYDRSQNYVSNYPLLKTFYELNKMMPTLLLA